MIRVNQQTGIDILSQLQEIQTALGPTAQDCIRVDGNVLLLHPELLNVLLASRTKLNSVIGLVSNPPTEEGNQ